MKSKIYHPRIVFLALGALLPTGCSFHSATVPTRHFVLASVSTNDVTPSLAQPVSVGFGFVKMPSYLLRDSIAIRNGANEIHYIESAMWAERLDQCLQRTVAADLSRLLPSESIYLSDWGRDQVMARVFITVQQFDVDVRGNGVLIADWRILGPEGNLLFKSGQARVERAGATPHGNPQVIVTTLSDLAAEFSRKLALSIREFASIHPRNPQPAQVRGSL